jgi:hypothetical protein
MSVKGHAGAELPGGETGLGPVHAGVGVTNAIPVNVEAAVRRVSQTWSTIIRPLQKRLAA